MILKNIYIFKNSNLYTEFDVTFIQLFLAFFKMLTKSM